MRHKPSPAASIADILAYQAKNNADINSLMIVTST